MEVDRYVGAVYVVSTVFLWLACERFPHLAMRLRDSGYYLINDRMTHFYAVIARWVGRGALCSIALPTDIGFTLGMFIVACVSWRVIFQLTRTVNRVVTPHQRAMQQLRHETQDQTIEETKQQFRERLTRVRCLVQKLETLERQQQ